MGVSGLFLDKLVDYEMIKTGVPSSVSPPLSRPSWAVHSRACVLNWRGECRTGAWLGLTRRAPQEVGEKQSCAKAAGALKTDLNDSIRRLAQ